MIDITGYVIDDINNGIDQNEYVSENVKVLTDGMNVITVFENNKEVLTTCNISKVIEYIAFNYIEKGEEK